MLPKPPSCKGCPFYGDGKGFVPSDPGPNKFVLVVGQNPGAEEEATGQPFVGKTGQMQDRMYLPKAGLTREDCNFDNVIRCRWKGSNDLPPVESKLFHDALIHCTKAHGTVPPWTKIVVATGDYATYGMTGQKMAQWRGWMLPWVGSKGYVQAGFFNSLWTPRLNGSLIPVLPTFHVAYLMRDPAMVQVALADWRKAGQYLQGKWPKACPPIEDHMPLGPGPISTFAFDTEFTPEGKLTRWSWALEASGLTYTMRRCGTVDWVPIPPLVLPPKVPIITQNVWADLDWLHKIFHVTDQQIHDTMLAHAVLFSDLPHDLDFLGSIYGSFNKWKHLYESNPVQYSALDALGTLDVWKGLWGEFKGDMKSWIVYNQYTRPLIPIIHKAQKTGMKVNHTRLKEVIARLSVEKMNAEGLAQAAVGYPINLASPTHVGHFLYDILGIKSGGKHA